MRASTQIAFAPELTGNVSIEWEGFTAELCNGIECGLIHPPVVAPVPRAPEFLTRISVRDSEKRWESELYRGQVEFRTAPHRDFESLWDDLDSGIDQGRKVAHTMGCSLQSMPCAPENILLEVYPIERYEKMAQALIDQGQEWRLRAACRVAALQMSYGCSDIDHALRVFNAAALRLPELIAIEGSSGAERLRLYCQMAPNWHPPQIESVEHFDQLAKAQGFATNIRNCYWLIRLNRHGTVEFRMWGSTDKRNEVKTRYDLVRQICDAA